MTDKEKFLAGSRFVLTKDRCGEAMRYSPPIGNHPFGSLLTAGSKYHVAICETPSITDNGFSCWGYWMGTHQFKKVLFSELSFWDL